MYDLQAELEMARVWVGIGTIATSGPAAGSSGEQWEGLSHVHLSASQIKTYKATSQPDLDSESHRDS
jgi:hypothetical protein